MCLKGHYDMSFLFLSCTCLIWPNVYAASEESIRSTEDYDYYVAIADGLDVEP
jgi:hypothetical protein